MNVYANYTLEEQEQAILLRAIEWSSFPSFLMEGIGVLLLIFFPIIFIIPFIIILSIVWKLFCENIINLKFSAFSVFINKLSLPTILICSIYFYIRGDVTLAVLSLFWVVIIRSTMLIQGIIINLLKIKPPRIDVIKEKMMGQLGG